MQSRGSSRLNLPVMPSSISSYHCASVERCSERADTRFQRLVRVFLRGSYEHDMSPAHYQPFDTDRFVATGEQVMEAVAKVGNCVLVGRGALEGVAVQVE